MATGATGARGAAGERGDPDDQRGGSWLHAKSDWLLSWAEDGIYAVVAVILVTGAAVLIVNAVATFIRHADEGMIAAATELLSVLLLVFVFVELLAAVRLTLRERQLLAEPFLLVGIIASIKEIVVLSVKAPDYVGTDKIEDTVWLMGVLTVTIGVLAASTLLVRRKEREPSEGDGAGPDAAHDKRADEPAQAS